MQLFRIITLPLLFFVLGWGSPLKAERIDYLYRSLPEDTSMVLYAPEMDLWYEAFDDHVVLSLWKDKAIKDFFAPLIQMIKMNGDQGEGIFAALDLSKEDIKEIFSEQMLLALLDVPFIGEKKESVMDFLIITDYEGNRETFLKLIAFLSGGEAAIDDFSTYLKEENYLDVKLYLENTDIQESDTAMAFTLVDQKFFVAASSIDSLKDWLSRYKEEGDFSPFVEQPGLQKMIDDSDDMDGFFYMNLQPFVHLLRERAAQQSNKEQKNTLFSLTGVLDSLGLDVFQGIYLTIDIQKNALALKGGVPFSKNRGLVNLIAYEKDSMRQPDFIPDDVMLYSYSRFNFSTFYKQLKQILSDNSPMIGAIIKGTMNQLKMQVGVDIEADIIDKLGKEYISFSRPSSEDEWDSNAIEGINTFYAIAIEDRKRMEIAIENLKTGIGGEPSIFEKKDYLGTTLYSLKKSFVSTPQQNFAYALTDSYLLMTVGSVTLLEEVIARLEKSDKSFWDDPNVNDLLDRQWPDGESQMTYYDFSQILPYLLSTIVAQQIFFTKEANAIFDSDAIPSSTSFPFIAIEKTYKEMNGLFSEALIVEKRMCDKFSFKTSLYRIVIGLLLLFFLGANVSSASFKLTGPEVAKSDWNIRSLIAHDFDGDGYNDLAIINNDRARIELFYHKNEEQGANKQRFIRQDRWEPVLENTRFIKRNIVCGQHLYNLAATDFNDDGHMDLIYTGSEDPLTVRFQDNKGDWNKTLVYKDIIPSQWDDTLKVADLDNDGSEEIILLADKVFIFRSFSSNVEALQPETYRLSEAKAYGLQIIDVNKDGLLDLLYLIHNNDHALRVRLQSKTAGFGPEFSFNIKPESSIIHPYSLKEDDSQAFVYIQAKTYLLKLFQLIQASEPPSQLKDLQPRTYPVFASENASVSYCIGDFNGDNLEDIAVSDLNDSQVLIYFQNTAGIFKEPQSFPSLAKISGLASVRFETIPNANLIVLSEEEKLLGIAQMAESGRLSFPEPINVEGRPVAIATADLEEGDDSELIVIEKLEEHYQLSIIGFSNTLSTINPYLKTVIPLESLKRKPNAIHVADLNNDTRLDIVILIPREAALLLLQTETGGFEEVAAVSPVRKSQLKNMTPASLNSADINGDGYEELIIARTGFFRSLQLNPNNECVIIDQYNAHRSEDKIGGPLFIDLDKDEEDELLFYNFTAKTLELLKRDESGVYRYTQSTDIGEIDLVSAKTLLLGTEKKPSVLFLGKDRFWSIPLDEKGWEVKTIASYETDLKDVAYTDLITGDLNNDHLQDIVAIDGRKHLLEIFNLQAIKQWKSVMYFTIFDDNIHYRGRRGAPLEPRQILITDLSNDGREDIVLLTHDRLLIYFQE